MKKTGMSYKMTFVLSILVFLLSGLAEAKPNISTSSPIQIQSGSEINLHGSGFGVATGVSEVIANYGQGFFYVLKHSDWSDTGITVTIPDSGKNLVVELHVKVGNQRSNSVAITIKPNILRNRHKDVKKEHTLNVGDKGEDVFKVLNKTAICGKHGELFDHALITFDKKRFADAQFVALPKKGCVHCQDIRVRWYNEPTGLIKYHLSIFQRQIEGICLKRIRHR